MADDLRPDPERVTADNEGLLSSGDVRTGFITGATFTNKAVQYEVVGDLAFFEGDICLGRPEELERGAGLLRVSAGQADGAQVEHGVIISGDQYRWPNAVVPFVIDAALPNQQRVTDAIAHWHANTVVRLVQRTAANASQYPNFLRFFRGDGCWSHVGMRGGQQDLSLADGCGLGAAIHEIGHAVGLWHEQSREDRDSFVTINWANISPGREHNFNQHISDGDDVGGYDYGSIMHYGTHAFSRNGLPTIVPTQSGVTIGQRTGLSAGDIAAVHHMYRAVHQLTVSQVFATPEHKNAWAHVSGQGVNAGWRKIHPNAPDGVTNTLLSLATARAYNRTVSAQVDGGFIYQVYSS